MTIGGHVKIKKMYLINGDMWKRWKQWKIINNIKETKEEKKKWKFLGRPRGGEWTNPTLPLRLADGRRPTKQIIGEGKFHIFSHLLAYYKSVVHDVP